MSREIITTPAESLAIGTLPKGCKMCIKGEKLVLFVHGICHRGCYYCPLSQKRKGKISASANEAEVKTDEDILKEAKLCDAKGTGITGGEPLIHVNKTIHYIKLLKKHFGNSFHTHLYTSGDHADEKILKSLKEAGLDEIRYHIRHDNWNILKTPLSLNIKTGVEIPCIPGELEYLKKLVVHLDKIGVNFLNLNEFEMSELTAKDMTKKGFETNGAWYNSVEGSKNQAEELLKFAAENTKNISIHFCNSKLKDAYQFKNRLKRRAKSIKKKFETISSGYLLEKGAVLTDKTHTLEVLLKKVRLKKEDYFERPEKNRIEMSIKNAKKASKHGFQAQIIEEVPSADSFDMEVTPIGNKKATF
ncbi:radical SAM protein [archaeon]|nr:radical SAM protein [archaeon]